MDPYIGITDFTRFSQVEMMLRVFDAYTPKGSNRKLHVGVMMNHKTLHGIPNKWQDVFPKKETHASIFGSSETYNCIHLADYERHKAPFVTHDDIFEVLSLGGPNIHAIQLDMVWPDPYQIEQAVLGSKKQVEVILQVGSKALAEIDDDPRILVKVLESYEGVIDRVLLDKSMGHGVPMNPHELMEFAEVIRKGFPALGIVAAGGLGPKSVQLVEPFLEFFPDISIDAQSKLRPSGSALDPIDWAVATEYLIKAIKLLS